jgi:hypothetical protein
MAHYLPCKSTATAVDIANIFIANIWKLHGTPKATVSDRGSTFNSKFIRHLYKRLDVKPTFSTAYHPRTDGQSERANQVVEIFIRAFVNHRQNDWVALLPMAEFAYNNGIQASTGKTPFQICQGFNPRMNIGEESDYTVPEADAHAEFLLKGYDKVKAALILANQSYKHYFDKGAKEPEEINPGDKVWLNHQNISTDRPSVKLSHKVLGPYKVMEKVGTHAFRLELPKSMKIHPVFHVMLLKKFHSDPHSREPAQPPPIVTQEGEEEWEVEEILNSKKIRRQLHYYVKWKGYSHADNSWQSKEDLKNAPELVDKFHKLHPTTPGP